MKNDFFDLNRFWSLSKKTFIENWINIIGITAGAILLMLFYFNLKSLEFINVQFTTIQFLTFSSTILTTILLNKFSNKSKSIDYLLFPVSNFEKLLVVFLMVYLFHFCLFLLFHQLFVHLYFDTYLIEFQKNPQYLKPEKITLLTDGFAINFRIIIFYQLFITMGTLIFKRNSYFKSLAVLLIICLVIYYFNNLITFYIFQDSSITSIPFTSVSLKNSNVGTSFLAGSKDIKLFINLFNYVLPICFLLISYFKLKEKEV